MALLDAALAFALTLAALATVVTILLEIIVRVLGLKARSQVALVLKLAEEVHRRTGKTKASNHVKSWEIVRKVLENPMAKKGMANSADSQRYLGAMRSPIYTDFSLEHFLRRVLDIDKIREAMPAGRRKLTTVLNTLGARYEEFGAAASTLFKRRLQFWSLVVGIVLAGVMNVDGVRLFQTYLKNPEIAEKVIATLTPKEEATEPGKDKPSGATAGRSNASADVKPEEAIRLKEKELNTQLQEIQMLKLPIGDLYFPHCVLFPPVAGVDTLPDALCQKKLRICGWEFWKYIPLWFLKVLVTGLLIGLGAPYWYDVARRLAEVRLAFGGRGSGEQRNRGADPKKEPENRAALIDRIVRETN